MGNRGIGIAANTAGIRLGEDVPFAVHNATPERVIELREHARVSVLVREVGPPDLPVGEGRYEDPGGNEGERSCDPEPAFERAGVQHAEDCTFGSCKRGSRYRESLKNGQPGGTSLAATQDRVSR